MRRHDSGPERRGAALPVGFDPCGPGAPLRLKLAAVSRAIGSPPTPSGLGRINAPKSEWKGVLQMAKLRLLKTGYGDLMLAEWETDQPETVTAAETAFAANFTAGRLAFRLDGPGRTTPIRQFSAVGAYASRWARKRPGMAPKKAGAGVVTMKPYEAAAKAAEYIGFIAAPQSMKT